MDRLCWVRNDSLEHVSVWKVDKERWTAFEGIKKTVDKWRVTRLVFHTRDVCKIIN